MDQQPPTGRSHERWAHFRFSVIGPLLAAPPARGELQRPLKELAAQKWRHPLSGAWIVLGRSTLERWYYKALRATASPVDVLQRKIRSDHGTHPAWSAPLSELLRQQHPSWSYQLHADNLAVLVQQQPELGPMPAYASVLRFMKSQGLFKRPRRGPVHSSGAQAAEHRYQAREVRSYESEYVNALLAPGLSPRLLARPPAYRSMGLSPAAGHLGRPLAPGRSPPMVSGRRRRGTRSRPEPGLPETPTAPLGPL